MMAPSDQLLIISITGSLVEVGVCHTRQDAHEIAQHLSAPSEMLAAQLVAADGRSSLSLVLRAHRGSYH